MLPKNTLIPNFIKIRLVGAEFFYMQAGRQTDERTAMMKLIVTFRNSWDAPKNSLINCLQALILYCVLVDAEACPLLLDGQTKSFRL
jgi:hypothetical protein